MRLLWDGSFGSTTKINDTLMTWVPLVLAAAGLLVTFQAGLWNIGVEGQIIMGAIGASWAARTFVGPSGIVVPVAILAGALFGALWALLPGLLRTRFRVHEIFSGVALYFVAGAVAIYLIIGPWSRAGVASTSGTDLFDPRVWLPTIGGNRLSPVAAVIAIAAIVGVWALLRGTRFGLRLKAVGRNPASARLMGIGSKRYVLAAFAICGALGGAAGAIQALGFHHKLVPSISGGFGFLGILVVLLSGFAARWIGPLALFFAAIQVGSTQLSLREGIDSSLAGVMQGILVLFVILVGGWQARRTRRSGTVDGLELLPAAPTAVGEV
jgi:simple sugar transport system permease protein